ncbi:MAG: hypothetical protein KatS3mg087_2089 [Patescibacteria group bacterium]|nr:MAG: hypothetical protein KatS3mg087_2089 [Patescibacteria group bacterium]
MSLPDWLMPLELKNTYKVNIDKLYVEWLTLLGIDYVELDAYWYEVLFQCAKFDALLELEKAGICDFANSVTLVFSGDKDKWYLRLFSEPDIPPEITAGQQAKMLYSSIRGRLPRYIS